jgi:hypothetical protein
MAEETGNPDGQPGDARHGPDGRVVDLPRDWFGPRDELVPIGPPPPGSGSPAPESEAAPRLAGGSPSLSADPPAPLAVDFWGGVTRGEDLSRLRDAPASQASQDGPAVGAESPWADRSGGSAPNVLRRVRRGGAALVAVALIGAVVAARVLAPRPSVRLPRPGTQTLAHVGGARPGARPPGSLGARDEPRAFGVRAPNAPYTHRAVSPRRRARASKQSHSSLTPRVSSGQPVVYSTPGATQPAASTGAPSAASAASDAGSGGESPGRGSFRAGPTGPGAPFGPGTLAR